MVPGGIMMRTEEKSKMKNSIGRLIFVALSVLLQIVWIVSMVVRLNKYSSIISLATSLVALIVVLRIYAVQGNPAFKMSWIMLILIFPVMGLCLYLLFGHSNVSKGMRKQFEKIDAALDENLKQDNEVYERLKEENPAVANQTFYIYKYGRYPVYQNTEVVFYDEAEKGLEAQKEALMKAEKFIFMEYHAIEDAEAFAGIKKILIQKAKEGVEVRILYDDVGSIGFINPRFIKNMEAEGIQCRVFNPIVPILLIFMNNRDHRKITVIDGKVGFTGGYNLANEYFNITQPYGRWKDTGIKLTGDAVNSLTCMFLEMWNVFHDSDKDYTRYLTRNFFRSEEKGYVLPYGDCPLDGEPVGENVYMNIIKNAKRYVYFTTPYLIISDEMQRELSQAAKRGVDVRIITPGIPDKKLIFQVTRSYYAGLVKNGIRIYEYTPGFIHAKQCVCDDEVATVGTINLDYRSLYFHFENGTFLYQCSAIEDIKRDFDRTFPVCSEVTEKYQTGRAAAIRIGQCILRLFAPLL
jgi:cardiolipin synthase